MSALRYFTARAVDRLRSTVVDQLDWYYSPSAPFAVQTVGAVRESRLPYPDLASGLETSKSKPYATDATNAVVVYSALAALTPQQASMERMWTYLCHCECPQYVTARWLSRRPAKEEDAVRKIRNHFFARGNRALIRDNALSRLWWLGKIAHDIDPDDPLRFLTILLHRQDVRSALIERPSVSMNRKVLQGIYRVMRDSWENGGNLFRRDVFRSWMIALNRRGGVLLLDSLPPDELYRVVDGEAAAAIEEAGRE